MDYRAIKQRGKIGRPSCDMGERIDDKKCQVLFKKGVGNANQDYKNIILSLNKNKFKPDRFVVKIKSKKNPTQWIDLKPNSKLGEGGYGKVYEFVKEDGDEKLECAVKFMVSKNEDIWHSSQSYLNFNPHTQKEIKEAEIVKKTQEDIDCSVAISILFSSQFFDYSNGLKQRLEVVVMEKSPLDLVTYCRDLRNKSLAMRTSSLCNLIKSITENYLCITKVYTVFPDAKLGNLAIACQNDESDPKSVVYIDTDGIFTLRSKDGKIPISRTGSYFKNNKLICEYGKPMSATYVPKELADAFFYTIYDENLTVIGSFFSFLFSIIDSISIVLNKSLGIDRADFREVKFSDCKKLLSLFCVRASQSLEDVKTQFSKKIIRVLKQIIKILDEMEEKKILFGMYDNKRMKTMKMWDYVIENGTLIQNVFE